MWIFLLIYTKQSAHQSVRCGFLNEQEAKDAAAKNNADKPSYLHGKYSTIQIWVETGES